MDSRKKVDILKISNSAQKYETDVTAVEKLLNIYVNKELYASLMCTPNEEIELSIGFLFAEGIIDSTEAIKSVAELTENIVCVVLNYDLEHELEEKKAITSGCAKGSLNLKVFEGNNLKPVESSCSYSADFILSIMREFNQRSELFKETGGVHSCSICNEEGVLYFSEDIGRHNALDKVIGKALLNKVELKDKLLITTGRVSSDIAVKASRAGIPIIVSHSAPTDMAIDIARASNITLAGFARGSRMNLYCGSQRISL